MMPHLIWFLSTVCQQVLGRLWLFDFECFQPQLVCANSAVQNTWSNNLMPLKYYEFNVFLFALRHQVNLAKKGIVETLLPGRHR